MPSLKDQLLNAGLINQKQAKKAAKSSKKSRTLKKEIQSATEIKKADQLEKDKLANQSLKQQADQKAIAAQIKQLIESHAISETGEIDYNFDHNGKVKTLRVCSKIRNQLINGQAAVALNGEKYTIIPTPIAEKINQRNEGYIVLLNTLTETDEDDPYADFQIPDDLMW